ncbi:MAG: VOC family protein [Muribaculum sp.]|nr:VOC family protein [Ruminococcus flavefaciens]MCM1373637.1 VOC family protein [Muribaculum sp.]
MLIPHLHFCGNCEEAIAIYEKAFQTKAESIVYSREYENIVPNHDHAPDEAPADNRIAHAVMYIHGQKVFLNDRFGNKDKSLDCAVHLIVMFTSVEELLACYEFFKEESTIIDPFTKLPYSELSGNFVDKFGVQWGFMTEQ